MVGCTTIEGWSIHDYVDRLRTAVAGFVLVGALAAVPAVAAPGAPTRVSTRAKAELTLQPGLGATVLARVNVVRAMRGLGRVTFSAALGASAALHLA